MTDLERGAENGFARAEAGLDGGVGLDDESSAKGVRSRAEKVIEKAERLTRSTLGDSAARQVREKGQMAAETMQDVVDRTSAQLEAQVARDPFRALAIAVGIGLGLGLMMGRRSHTIIYRPIRD